MTRTSSERVTLKEATRRARHDLVDTAALYRQHYAEAFFPVAAAPPTVLERLPDGKQYRVQVRIPSTDPARSVPPPAGDVELQTTLRDSVAAVSACLATLGDYHRPRIPGSDRLGDWTPSPDPLIRWTPRRPGPLPQVDAIAPELFEDAIRAAHGLLTLAEQHDPNWTPAQSRLIHRACRWTRLALHAWDTPPATPSQKGPWGNPQLRTRARDAAAVIHGTYLTPPGGWPGNGPRCRTCTYGEIHANGECKACGEYRRRTGRPRPEGPRCRSCGQGEIKAGGQCKDCIEAQRRREEEQRRREQDRRVDQSHPDGRMSA